MLKKAFKRFKRHDLSAEKNLFNGFGRSVIKRMKGAEKTQRGDCPDHYGNFFFTQIVNKLGRRRKKPARNNGKRCRTLERRINILNRNIKIKRRLICKNVSFRKAEGF